MANNKRVFLLFLFLVTTITEGDELGSSSGVSELLRPDNVHKECNSVVVCKLEAAKLSGPTGLAEARGKPGEKGDKGDTGLSGTNGLPGVKGDSGQKGDKGDVGLSGLIGVAGAKGDPGQKGDKGEMGPPGRIKVCPSGSRGDSSKPDVVINEESYGTIDLPGDFLCAKENKNLLPKDRELWVVGEKNPISVYCKETDYATCVIGSTSGPFKFGNETKPFWLSEMPIDMSRPIDLTMSQLQWLQERSSSVYQTIRYYCKNSRPYNPEVLEKSILLSTWNNIVIGPEPSLNTPLKYTVLEDQCSGDGKGKSLYTEIEVRTNVVQRLPVLDYLIRDVEKADQEVSIETVELCFL